VALVRGGVGPADIDDTALDDPEILRLSEGLRMTEDAACNATFPAERHARVTLVLQDGTRLQSGTQSPRWDHRAPPSDTELEAKFHDLADPVLGAARARAIRQALEALPDAPLDRLTDLLFQPIS
jgi:2-methylcitrate dehydratase PrpD